MPATWHPLPILILLGTVRCVSGAAVTSPDALRLTSPLQWDGVERVQHGDDVASVSRGRQIVIELSLGGQDTHRQQRTTLLAQLVAQSLSHLDSAVVLSRQEYQTTQYKEWQGVAGTGVIIVHHQGVGVPYYGLHTPEALVGFVHKVLRRPVNRLEGKLHKKAFEKLQQHRLIGFFDLETPELRAFQEAASHLHPYFSFYVVQDSKVAKQLKLKQKNTIQFYRTYDSKPSKLAPAPDEWADILEFIQENWDSTLDQLSPHDIHAPWHLPSSAPVVLVYLRPQSPEDAVLFKAVKTVAKDNHNNQRLRMLLVNPDLFMDLVPQWEHMYNIDLRYAALGILDHTQESSVWFNATEVKSSICVECVSQEITAWLEHNLHGYHFAEDEEEEEEEEEEDEGRTVEGAEGASASSLSREAPRSPSSQDWPSQEQNINHGVVTDDEDVAIEDILGENEDIVTMSETPNGEGMGLTDDDDIAIEDILGENENIVTKSEAPVDEDDVSVWDMFNDSEQAENGYEEYEDDNGGMESSDEDQAEEKDVGIESEEDDGPSLGAMFTESDEHTKEGRDITFDNNKQGDASRAGGKSGLSKKDKFNKNDVTISGFVKDVFGNLVEIVQGDSRANKGGTGGKVVQHNAIAQNNGKHIPLTQHKVSEAKSSKFTSPPKEPNLKVIPKRYSSQQDDEVIRITSLLRDGVTKLIEEIRNLDTGSGGGHHGDAEDVTIEEAIQGIYTTLFADGDGRVDQQLVEPNIAGDQTDKNEDSSKTVEEEARHKTKRKQAKLEKKGLYKIDKPKYNENDVTIKDAVRGMLSKLFGSKSDSDQSKSKGKDIDMEAKRNKAKLIKALKEQHAKLIQKKKKAQDDNKIGKGKFNEDDVTIKGFVSNILSAVFRGGSNGKTNDPKVYAKHGQKHSAVHHKKDGKNIDQLKLQKYLAKKAMEKKHTENKAQSVKPKTAPASMQEAIKDKPKSAVAKDFGKKFSKEAYEQDEVTIKGLLYGVISTLMGSQPSEQAPKEHHREHPQYERNDAIKETEAPTSMQQATREKDEKATEFGKKFSKEAYGKDELTIKGLIQEIFSTLFGTESTGESKMPIHPRKERASLVDSGSPEEKTEKSKDDADPNDKPAAGDESAPTSIQEAAKTMAKSESQVKFGKRFSKEHFAQDEVTIKGLLQDLVSAVVDAVSTESNKPTKTEHVPHEPETLDQDGIEEGDEEEQDEISILAGSQDAPASIQEAVKSKPKSSVAKQFGKRFSKESYAQDELTIKGLIQGMMSSVLGSKSPEHLPGQKQGDEGEEEEDDDIMEDQGEQEKKQRLVDDKPEQKDELSMADEGKHAPASMQEAVKFKTKSKEQKQFGKRFSKETFREDEATIKRLIQDIFSSLAGTPSVKPTEQLDVLQEEIKAEEVFEEESLTVRDSNEAEQKDELTMVDESKHAPASMQEAVKDKPKTESQKQFGKRFSKEAYAQDQATIKGLIQSIIASIIGAESESKTATLVEHSGEMHSHETDNREDKEEEPSDMGASAGLEFAPASIQEAVKAMSKSEVQKQFGKRFSKEAYSQDEVTIKAVVKNFMSSMFALSSDEIPKPVTKTSIVQEDENGEEEAIQENIEETGHTPTSMLDAVKDKPKSADAKRFGKRFSKEAYAEDEVTFKAIFQNLASMLSSETGKDIKKQLKIDNVDVLIDDSSHDKETDIYDDEGEVGHSGKDDEFRETRGASGDDKVSGDAASEFEDDEDIIDILTGNDLADGQVQHDDIQEDDEDDDKEAIDIIMGDAEGQYESENGKSEEEEDSRDDEDEVQEEETPTDYEIDYVNVDPKDDKKGEHIGDEDDEDEIAVILGGTTESEHEGDGDINEGDKDEENNENDEDDEEDEIEVILGGTSGSEHEGDDEVNEGDKDQEIDETAEDIDDEDDEIEDILGCTSESDEEIEIDSKDDEDVTKSAIQKEDSEKEEDQKEGDAVAQRIQASKKKYNKDDVTIKDAIRGLFRMTDKQQEDDIEDDDDTDARLEESQVSDHKPASKKLSKTKFNRDDVTIKGAIAGLFRMVFGGSPPEETPDKDYDYDYRAKDTDDKPFLVQQIDKSAAKEVLKSKYKNFNKDDVTISGAIGNFFFGGSSKNKEMKEESVPEKPKAPSENQPKMGKHFKTKFNENDVTISGAIKGIFQKLFGKADDTQKVSSSTFEVKGKEQEKTRWQKMRRTKFNKDDVTISGSIGKLFRMIFGGSDDDEDIDDDAYTYDFRIKDSDTEVHSTSGSKPKKRNVLRKTKYNKNDVTIKGAIKGLFRKIFGGSDDDDDDDDDADYEYDYWIKLDDDDDDRKKSKPDTDNVPTQPQKKKFQKWSKYNKNDVTFKGAFKGLFRVVFGGTSDDDDDSNDDDKGDQDDKHMKRPTEDNTDKQSETKHKVKRSLHTKYNKDDVTIKDAVKGLFRMVFGGTGSTGKAHDDDSDRVGEDEGEVEEKKDKKYREASKDDMDSKEDLKSKHTKYNKEDVTISGAIKSLFSGGSSNSKEVVSDTKDRGEENMGKDEDDDDEDEDDDEDVEDKHEEEEEKTNQGTKKENLKTKHTKYNKEDVTISGAIRGLFAGDEPSKERDAKPKQDIRDEEDEDDQKQQKKAKPKKVKPVQSRMQDVPEESDDMRQSKKTTKDKTKKGSQEKTKKKVLKPGEAKHTKLGEAVQNKNKKFHEHDIKISSVIADGVKSIFGKAGSVSEKESGKERKKRKDLDDSDSEREAEYLSGEDQKKKTAGKQKVKVPSKTAAKDKPKEAKIPVGKKSPTKTVPVKKTKKSKEDENDDLDEIFYDSFKSKEIYKFRQQKETVAPTGGQAVDQKKFDEDWDWDDNFEFIEKIAKKLVRFFQSFKLR